MKTKNFVNKNKPKSSLDAKPSMDLVDSCQHMQTETSIERTQLTRASPCFNQLIYVSDMQQLCSSSLHILCIIPIFRSLNKCHNDYCIFLDWISIYILVQVLTRFNCSKIVLKAFKVGVLKSDFPFSSLMPILTVLYTEDF